MRLRNHKIEGVPFIPAKLTGGKIVPEIVIMHDTAGRLEAFNSRDYLARTTVASVHFVVERDGTVSQLVATNLRAGHAGQSSYHGRKDCNAFSIGIEIVNPGKLTRGLGGSALAWWGQDFGYGAYQVVEAETKEHGRGIWMPYAPEQIEAVIDLLEALFAGIPTLKDITTHWYVSPGRKIDTNPLFPLEAIRARVFGRDDPAAAEAEAASAQVAADQWVQVNTPGDTLTLRRWPSFNPNAIAAIPHAAVVPVIRRGSFDGRDWLLVQYAGHEGWIVARYATPFNPDEVSR
ncbi:N-acetylmuramoyl-L-alanine amidase [Pseudotabrizicola algicola]|uniref:N-acetylmuramoyl-L-alanine amidase n=1 Tax=Pseudotabrizicola algicola TaxID=2709381 RepID=A0A6B3RX25_9RHOB|nr:N-acetylmuramoyl-L-alanine amidase [Pseudotabrizicola algicola]NEX47619.1 N-acetylmuramoyl-L-alanine amidase [Pseudotabrizicola algicola]